MKIKDIYKKKNIVFSCEVFPPKPEDNIETIYNTISELKEISPDFVSVTCSADGGTKKRTLQISSKIKNEYKLDSLMHLTCINTKYDDILEILDEARKMGIENILALRGDIPPHHLSSPLKGEERVRGNVTSDFRYAADLVDFIKKNTDFCVGVAGYPEVHPESPDSNLDIKYLKSKIDKGADFIITQLFFKNEYFYRFLDRIRSAGINVPVSVGIMPVFKAKLIKKIVTLCGATISPELQNLIDKYGHKPLDMEKSGIEYATNQIYDLLNQGINGIHIYTMNKAHLAKEIFKNINLK